MKQRTLAIVGLGAVVAVGAILFARSPRLVSSAATPIRAERLLVADANADGDVADAVTAPDAKRRASVSHVAGTCTATFAPDGEAELFDHAIASAVLEPYDLRTGVPTAYASDAAPNIVTVASCNGQTADVWPKGADDAPSPHVEVHSFEIANRSAIGDSDLLGAVAARVLVGTTGGLCDEESGFLAIVTLQDRTVMARALAPWSAHACSGADGAISAMRWADTWVVLEDGGDQSGEQPTNQARKIVWRRDGQTLTSIGSVLVSVTQERPFGDDPKQNKVAMTATLETTPRGVVAHETWTFERMKTTHEGTAFAPIPGQKPWTKKLDRAYFIEGDKVVSSPSEYDWPKE